MRSSLSNLTVNCEKLKTAHPVMEFKGGVVSRRQSIGVVNPHTYQQLQTGKKEKDKRGRSATTFLYLVLTHKT
jgi:hypothetical protein